MKVVLCLIISIGFMQQFCAQSKSNYRIIRSNLGSSGSSQSVETLKGRYYISQSVGQASVIGTHFNKGYYLRQGYQQPSHRTKSVSNFNTNLKASVYPNPFNQRFFVSFSDTIFNDISVQVFDVEARMIHAQEFLPSQNIELQLQDISSGIYFLKVTSGQKLFNSKLIKN